MTDKDVATGPDSDVRPDDRDRRRARPRRERLRGFFGSPVFLILVIAPFFGEGLSGSSPPLDLVLPWHFAFMCALYGSGALLCRELVHRLDLGMTGLILLGCAYGVYEEGIVDRYFFLKHYWETSGVDQYSVVGQTNVLLAAHLTTFHATVSITLSVLVVEWLRPRSRRRPWVTRRGLIIAAVALASTPLLYGEFEQRPPLFTLAVTVGILIILITAAVVLGRRRQGRTRRARTSRRGISLVCLLCALAHWVIVYTVPQTGLAWPLGVGLAVLPVLIALVVVPRMISGDHLGRDAMRAGSGIIAFFVGLDVFAGVVGFRPDLILSAVATAVALVLLRRRAPQLCEPRPEPSPAADAVAPTTGETSP